MKKHFDFKHVICFWVTLFLLTAAVEAQDSYPVLKTLEFVDEIAGFSNPTGITSDGRYIYVVAQHTPGYDVPLYKIDPYTMAVISITNLELHNCCVQDLTWDADNNCFWISDSDNVSEQIWRYDPGTGDLTFYCDSSYPFPIGLECVDGVLYASNQDSDYSSDIAIIDPTNCSQTYLVDMPLYNTYGIGWNGHSFIVAGRTVPNDPDGFPPPEPKKLYDYATNGTLLGYYEPELGAYTYGIEVLGDYLYVCDYGAIQGGTAGTVKKYKLSYPAVGTWILADELVGFTDPTGITTDGRYIYVIAQHTPGYNVPLYKIDPATMTIVSVTDLALHNCCVQDLTWDADNNCFWISDSDNVSEQIWRYDPGTGDLTYHCDSSFPFPIGMECVDGILYTSNSASDYSSDIAIIDPTGCGQTSLVNMLLYNVFGITWNGHSFIVAGRTVPSDPDGSPLPEPKKLYNYATNGTLLGYYEPELGAYTYGIEVLGNYLYVCDYGMTQGSGSADGTVKKLLLDPAVATLLQSVDLDISESGIVIKWQVSEILENVVFSVSRLDITRGVFEELSNANVVRDGLVFTFVDTDCEKGSSYRYRVNVLDENGERVFFETESVTLPANVLTLYANYPNPFNPVTTIKYDLPNVSYVKLEIYDVAGRKLKTLVDGVQEKGPQAVNWDGTDNRGNSLVSGVYFCRITAGKESCSKKLLMLR